ncbi:MAG: hypothetical protein ACLGIN_01555, partial [Candidatus Sericytochromatia bacterium]
PTPAPTATPQPAPPEPMRTLTGVIRIDPSYIISAGGGNLIGHAGGNYRLAQAASAMLPAQGLQVEVISLLTGKRVAGPVETDAQGAYQLEVPEDGAGNLLIRAFPPAAEADPRLQYRLMVEPEAAEAGLLDEDTSLMTRLIVECVATRLERQFIQSVEESLAYLPESFREQARPQIEVMHAEGQAANLAALDEATRKQVLRRAAQILLAHSEFKQAQNPLVNGQPAMESLVEVFEAVRLALEKKLAENPNFADAKQNPTGREILKVTDLGEYALEVFRTAETQGALLGQISETLMIVGVDGDVNWKLLGAYLAIAGETGRTLKSHPEAMADIRRVLRAGE